MRELCDLKLVERAAQWAFMEGVEFAGGDEDDESVMVAAQACAQRG